MNSAASALSLRAERLSVSYGRHSVIADLVLDPVPAGVITSLLGPNGSGKSTLLRALAGLHHAPGRVRGRVMLGDLDLLRMPVSRRAQHCVYLPQALPPAIHMQVMESVLAAAHSGGRSGAAGVEDAFAVLAGLGIEGLALRFMDELSGGQRQLVGLAQALVRRPSLLLLDEPLSALDLRHQYTVMDMVRRETEARGMVTVIVLHDLTIALRRTDRAILLAEGRILGAGLVREVVTPALLAAAYAVAARVEQCSAGDPVVVVDGPLGVS